MAGFEDIRREYKFTKLDYEDLSTDPFSQFKFWMNDAIKAGITDTNAMALATAGTDSKPSLRMVLLKGLDSSGFIFFTNYNSKKGIEIAQNPYAALMFYWGVIDRQVRIEGQVDKISRKESDDYFSIRPEGSKLGAWASPQSQRIPNRQYLEQIQEGYEDLFKNRPIERPENWGGYRLIPNLFEFWQGRENRLHDRFVYQWVNGAWEINRLAP